MTLTDRNGHVLGYITETGHGQIIKSPNGAVLGNYNSDMNMTFKSNGTPVGKGNLLTMLL